MTHPLQGLITGYMAAALALNPDVLKVDVEIVTDSDGNYRPEIIVRGQESGVTCMVTVAVLG